MGSSILTGEQAVAEGNAFLSEGSSGWERRMANPEYKARVVEAGRLFARAYHGDGHARADLREAMSTSDFPKLFGDVLSRTLAKEYAQAAPVWRQFAAPTTVSDFREQHILDFTGGGGLLDSVPEYGEYPARSFSESEKTFKVGKFGARLHWSWEMNVNDDLGAFQRAPGALARSASSTEDHATTSVVASSTGPNSNLFSSTGTGKLTADNLESGLQSILDQTDDDGNPIDVGTPILMVPMALSQTAQNIINTTQVRQGSSTNQRITSGNNLSVTPRIVVNRWLTVIDQSANAKTTWYLLPEPSSARPAVYAAFLAGHQSPDLRVKADAGMYLGGGAVSPSEGSFERDSIEYRVRHILAGAQGFSDAVYASTGTAS